ncbi:hypothetical protein O1611_g3338 [Lasiodiplodia mahajangana]|uniref:Uncharacterized protein n=1 Tax=Lasiodiplodia mahajangana TaxID=1108764 RepID=A0ACC2JS30_9PEZI|nr:hypothetical protein O1611_g3338 [Lasiodiplodia mahajangana]
MTKAVDYGDYGYSETPPPHNGDVLLRAKVLQAELEQFIAHLTDVYEGYFQEFPKHMHVSLYNDVLSEVENLEKDMNSQDPLSSHRIASSNLPHLQAVWDAAKASKDIVKLRHPVFSGPFKHRILAPGIRVRDIMSQGGSEPKRNQNRRSLRIDVICDGGLSWYKVSTITNKRLLFDMAKEAVYCGDSDDSESTDDPAQNFSDIPLVKLAKSLKAIAQGHQIRNSSPVPSLLLPRLFEGEHAEVDKIVKICRDMGVKVLCGNAIAPPSPLSKDLFNEMVPSPRRSITLELNIDTSVLVALVSDISHSQATKQPWLGQSQLVHIDLETSDPLIPTLCPLLSDHSLVCTRDAARSLARIVHTMGTASENARAHLLLTPDGSMTHEQRVEEFRALSIHSDGIPSSLQLPIRVADFDVDSSNGASGQIYFNTIFQKLGVLAQPGRSVFSYGWAKGLTTVTCNALAVKQLEKRLEEPPDLHMPEWPSIWAFSSSRPLVGVPKGSDQQRMRKHIGDCRAACICGLEDISDSQIPHVTLAG